MFKYIFTTILILVYYSCPANSGNYLATTEALDKNQAAFKNQSFFIYPELRENPIRWFDSIPESKLDNVRSPEIFELSAQPGELYVYQVGVWALRDDVPDIKVKFSDLRGGNRNIIDAGKMTCYNKEGTDFQGNPFAKRVDVTAGRIQALWMGIDLEGVEEGNYTGSVSVSSGDEKHVIHINLNVSGEIVANKGYNEGKRLSRLNWLNSEAGIDQEVTKGYLPVKVEDNTINILGRKVTIAENGLPSSIISYFNPSNQHLVETGEYIINNSFRFVIEKRSGAAGDTETVDLVPGKLKFTGQTPSKVTWSVINSSEEFDLEVSGKMEFDGFVDYRLRLTSKVPARIKDIRLEIPVDKKKSNYMMGLGHEGGYRTPDWQWKWDVTKNQDMLWIGGVNGGLRIKWKGENYIRPLVNIYYAFGPLNLPASWGNEGKGGVDIGDTSGESVMVNAYSGTRNMKPGEQLNYDFELLITPFRLIDNQIKYEDRYYHGGGTDHSVKIKNTKNAGANIINIHHAEDLYPFINYPYLDDFFEELKQFVTSAHRDEMRMKFYYTTRELTIYLPEFWALNSLDGEVVFPGPGNVSRTDALHPKGPHEWLINNLRENYIPAWESFISEGKFKGERDISVITTPDSRLNNFYVAGLDWMVQNMDIDGVYIDDTAIDRYTLRRARKVIDRYRPEGRIDFHSWNHFNDWAGYTNCLNLYMDLLPYFDLTWIGEGRDYNRLPDHWLIEVSGIPFGLPGQMLEGGGNPWRGMVYGITNRAGWTKNTPKYLWDFFDEYNFAEREMIGYWVEDCPVYIDNPNLIASVFKGPDNAVIAIGNWSDESQTGSLRLDWSSLNMDPQECTYIIPGITEFQEPTQINSIDQLEIEGGKGLVIVVRANN